MEGEEGVAENPGWRLGRRRRREWSSRGRGGALLQVRREAGEERVKGQRRRIAEAEEQPAERRGGGGHGGRARSRGFFPWEWRLAGWAGLMLGSIVLLVCLVPRVPLDPELVVRPGLWPSLLQFDILISRFFTTVKFQGMHLHDFEFLTLIESK